MEPPDRHAAVPRLRLRALVHVGGGEQVLATPFAERAPQLTAMAAEAAASRLYGGIHYVSDNEAGLALGQAAGKAAVRAYGLR